MWEMEVQIFRHVERSEISVEDRGAMWDVGVTDVGCLHKK